MPCGSIMDEENFTCIKVVTKTIHIALPPAYVTNEISGISNILESWKQQYVQQLEGVLVNYKNVSLTSDSGYIVVEKPVVHYNVKATFELFCPSVGSIVKGKIIRISREHIACLVHNVINVTIDRPFSTSSDISYLITLDYIVLFQITSLNFHRKIIQIKGTINDECVNLMKMLPDLNAQNYVENTLSSNILTSELAESSLNEFEKENSTSETDSPSLLASTYPNLSSVKKNMKKSVSETSSDNLNESQSYKNMSLKECQNSISLTALKNDFIPNPLKVSTAKKNKNKAGLEATHLNEKEQEIMQSPFKTTEKSKLKHKKSKKATDELANNALSDLEENKYSKKEKIVDSVNKILSNEPNSNDINQNSSPKKKKTKKLYNEYALKQVDDVTVKPSPSKSNIVSSDNNNDNFTNLLLDEISSPPLFNDLNIIKKEELVTDQSSQVSKERKDFQGEITPKKKKKRKQESLHEKSETRKKLKLDISVDKGQNSQKDKKKSKKKHKEKSKKKHKEKSKKKHKEKSKKELKSIDELLKSRKKMLKKSKSKNEKTKKKKSKKSKEEI